MYRNPALLAACLAFAAMLLLISPGGTILAADGQQVRTLTRFSDGSPEAVLYFPDTGGSGRACLTLPRNAYIASAQFTLRGLPGPNGAYPADIDLAIGTPSRSIWSFDSGEMGRQRTFSGAAAVDLRFPAGGDSIDIPGFELPGDAVVRSASLQLVGSEGPAGPPLLFGEPADRTFVAWNLGSGRPLLVLVDNASLLFSEIDPATGAEVRRRTVELPSGGFTYVADLQYRWQEDTAAVLVPMRGAFLVNLTSGNVQRHFYGQEGGSLAAISYGGSYLAGIGSDWGGVRQLPSNDTLLFSASTSPGAFDGLPAAVAYDPAGQRLFCGRALSNGTLISVLGADRDAGIFHLSDVTDLLRLIYIPGQDRLAVGLGSYSGGAQRGPVMLLDPSSGALEAVAAFSGLSSGALGLQVEGGHLSALLFKGASGLVSTDLAAGTYDDYPVQLPRLAAIDDAAFDPYGERLLAVSGGQAWLLDLRNGQGRTLAAEGTVPPGITSVRTWGNITLLGTSAGAVALGPGGTVMWRWDRGSVTAMELEPRAGAVALGASEGWTYNASSGGWRFTRLNVTMLELANGTPSTRSWTVPLAPNDQFSRVSALAPDMASERLFIGIIGPVAASTLLSPNISNGELRDLAPPDTQVTSLALSPDGSKLYAGTGAGLLVTQLQNGAQRLLTPANGSGLLTSIVTDVKVDEFGRLLVGQGILGGPGGLTVFSPDLSAWRSYTAALEAEPYDVLGVARDPGTGRFFLGLEDGLVVVDESSNNELHVPGPFGQTYSSGPAMGSLFWNPQERALLWAGSGHAFALQWGGQRPENVSLDIGADGTPDWSAQGRLDSALIADLADAVSAALKAYGGGGGLSPVRLRVSSDSAGLLGLRSLVVVYDRAKKIEMAPMLAAELASRPQSGSGAIELIVTASGGGLALSNLSLTYYDDLPPVALALPALSVDAASGQPTILDLGRCFSDDHTQPADLAFKAGSGKTPAGVQVAVVYSRYLLIDARHSSFRGQLSINLTATDSVGLTSSRELSVTVVHSSEYRPPPPAYTYFLWVAGALLAAVGLWIAILFIRIRRGNKE